jgi:hypothetical protein
MSNWFIARDKHKFGPFSAAQLRQMAVLGLVGATDHLLEEGAAKWVPATTVAGLFPAVGDRPKSYWLLVEGKALGPYPAERIRVSLLRGLLAEDTLACVEGGTAWLPLCQLPEFGACLTPTPRSSHAQLGLGSRHLELSEEESRLHLAGKQGDRIARLISTLLDLARRYRDNPALTQVIERNIQDLKVIRERTVAAGQAPPATTPDRKT